MTQDRPTPDNQGAFTRSGSNGFFNGWHPQRTRYASRTLEEFVKHEGQGLPPLRVAVFGSFHRGLNLLKGLKALPEGWVEIVGLATDDPDLKHAGGQKRIWRYDEAYAQKSLVPDYAAQIGIEPYFGKVKSDEFYDLFENIWKPDIAVMGTFGQLINKRLIDTPSFGFYNCHPIGHPSKWADGVYAGPTPFEAMLERGDRQAKMILHEVSEKFDDGEWIYESDPIDIPEGATPVSLHEVTSPIAQEMMYALFLCARSQLTIERSFKSTREYRRHFAQLVPGGVTI